MRILKEFKAFAMKGNVVDMAVGIIIGSAFGKIVSSLVADVIMPPIGALLGNVDFSQLALTIKKGVDATPTTPAVSPVMLKYGLFGNAVIDFIIVSFCIFMIVRAMNSLR